MKAPSLSRCEQVLWVLLAIAGVGMLGAGLLMSEEETRHVILDYDPAWFCAAGAFVILGVMLWMWLIARCDNER